MMSCLHALLPANKRRFPHFDPVSSPAVSGRSPLVSVVALFFVVYFFHFSTRQQRFPPGVQFSVQRPMHVSVLSSSVQGMAQLFSCWVKCCIQISVLRTIFLRVSTHFSRRGLAVFVPCEVQRGVALII